jgi:hypothetical protein
VSKLEWFLVIASGAVLVPVAISLMGGGEYLAAIWNSLPAVGSGLAGFLVLSAIVAIYFIPTIVAYSVKHHNAAAIFLLNFFLGWTFLGWVAALVWSVTRPPTSSPTGTQKSE